VEKVIPDYDKEKVYVSDMKKLLKWYDILNGQKLVEELIKEEGTIEAIEKIAEAKAEEKQAKKTAAKPKKEAKPKVEKTTKASTKPAPGAKKVTAPRKAQ
ncbi:MAG TPA: hypothetical protein PL084_11750, partial [Chitinophagales bacterium]|nr:hypothetical protein [Chitinophagales bacterium]